MRLNDGIGMEIKRLFKDSIRTRIGGAMFWGPLTSSSVLAAKLDGQPKSPLVGDSRLGVCTV